MRCKAEEGCVHASQIIDRRSRVGRSQNAEDSSQHAERPATHYDGVRVSCSKPISGERRDEKMLIKVSTHCFYFSFYHPSFAGSCNSRVGIAKPSGSNKCS